MALSREEVRHIARLCRLSMSAEESDAMAEQLSQILEQFKRLQSLDTEQVPPTSHVADLRSVLREDATRPSLPVEDVLIHAPLQHADQFRVGLVIEE